MVKVQTNSQGKVYVANGKALLSDDGTKYGANISTLLGDVDANGVLQFPTEQSDLVFTGVEDIGSNVLEYKFSNSFIKSASFPDLTDISGEEACSHMFDECENLATVLLPELTAVSGKYGCRYMFSKCINLTSLSFTNLDTITGSSAFQYMCRYCSALTDMYFNAIKTTSFGSNTDQFGNMLAFTGTSVTHTLHFPSNLSSTISGLSGYPNFGGTSSNVVLAFDLPATS